MFLAFFLLDVLMFPKFLFSTPISFYFLLPIIFVSGRFELKSLVKIFILLTILLLSVLFGVASVGGDDSGNIKRMIQLFLVMSLVLFDYKKVDYIALISYMKAVLILFYIFVVIFLIIFSIDPTAYQNVVSFVYPEARAMLFENLSNSRYSLHFTDPNSFGYLVVFCFVLVLLLDFSFILKGLVFMTTTLIVLSTQSRGALLAFLLVVFAYWALCLNKKDKLYFIFLLAVGLLFSIIVFFESMQLYWNFYQERKAIEESMGKGIGGGRLGSWVYFFDNINLNPLFGVGYYLERDGSVFRPHSDFIRLNLSYGLLIYFILFSFFGSFRKKYLMLWVAFLIPFLVNTVIDDFRLFGIFVLAFFLIKNGSELFTGGNGNSRLKKAVAKVFSEAK